MKAFTPVCTTEMIAFAKANPYFERLNTCLLGLSVDSNPSHLAWIYDIYCRTGIVIPFPIIADRNGEIARKYGLKVIYDAAHSFGETYKGKSVGAFGDVSCFSFHATKVLIQLKVE